MGTVYYYTTIKTTLTIPKEYYDEDGWVRALTGSHADVHQRKKTYEYARVDKKGRVHVNAETKNWNDHMWYLLQDLSKIAESGELVVERTDELCEGATRYVVQPGSVQEYVPVVFWRLFDPDEEEPDLIPEIWTWNDFFESLISFLQHLRDGHWPQQELHIALRLFLERACERGYHLDRPVAASGGVTTSECVICGATMSNW